MFKKKILEISIIYLFYCWNNNCNCNYCNCPIIVVFGKKKDDSNSPPIPSPIPPIPPPINEIKIYEETISKKSSIIIYNNSEINQEKPIDYIGEYIFNIYNSDYPTGSEIYSAFVGLLKLKEKKGNTEKDIWMNDIMNNEINLSFPLIKFDFDKKGNKFNFQIPENSDSQLISYVKEFIDKIIPLNESNEYEIYYNDEKSKKTNNLDYKERIDNFNLSEASQNYIIHVENGTIDDVKSKRKTVLKFEDTKVNFESEFAGNFTNETQNSIDNIKKNYINAIIQCFESIVTLKSNEIEENKSKNLFEKINKLSYKDYNSPELKERRRRLNDILKNNKLLTNNQLRELDSFNIDYYYQPIIFSYPLFKTTFFDSKIGIFAKISFTPQNGLFEIKIDIDKDGEEIKTLHTEEYTNFGDINREIDNIINYVAYIISTNIEMNIEDLYKEYRDQLMNNLIGFNTTFNKFPDVSQIFLTHLDNLFIQIKHGSNNSFATLYENSSKTNELFESLKNNIFYKDENIIKNIIEISENELSLFLQTSQNFSNIIESSKIFFPNIHELVNYQLSLIEKGYDSEFNFDICTFYDIKDNLNELEKIFNNFENGVKIAINSENSSYYKYILEEYDNKINPILIYLEYIADMMKNNITNIVGHTEFYGQDYGDERRNHIINWINGLREQYQSIINNIFIEINETYEIKTNDLSENATIIINQYEDIKNNGTEFIEMLRNKGLITFDQNFTIYNEDINLIISIYMNASQIRDNAYKEYIIKPLNLIKDDFVFTRYESFKYYIDSIINNMINEIKKNNYNEANIISETLNDTINEKYEYYFNSNLMNYIVSKYDNKSLFEEMAEKYYNEVIPAFNEFNNSFFDKVYKSHVEDYVTRPSEIETRLRNYVIMEEKQINNLIEDINSLIINNIDKEINEGYEKVNNLLKNYLDYFHSQVPKEKYGIDDNENNYNLIEENLKKIGNNNLQKNLYNRKKRDEFNIEKYFSKKEFYITNNLGKIIDEIRNYFDQYICPIKEFVCSDENNNHTSYLYLTNFQITKLRESISHLKPLISIVDRMINENSLSGLNIGDFVKLFEDNLNFGADALIAQILDFLSEINKNTTLFIKDLTGGIDEMIKSIYNEAVNLGFIKGKIEEIAISIFYDPSENIKKMKDFLKNPCGPQEQIMHIFDEEIIYYEQKGSFSFDSSSYNEDYEKLVETIKSNFYNELHTFLKNIEIPDYIPNQLYDKFADYINNTYSTLKNKFLFLSNITAFEFLDLNYTLEEIIYNTLIELKDLHYNEVSELIEEIYQKYLEIEKNDIKTTLETRFNETLQFLKTQFDATYNKYANSSKVGTFTLDKLNNETKETIINAFLLFRDKADEIYNKDNFLKRLNNTQAKRLEELILEINYDVLMFNFTDRLNVYNKDGNERLNQEKLLFSSNIPVLFVKGFNQSIETFLNGIGKEYLNSIFMSDYLTNIANNFREITINANNTYNYMNALLDDPKTKLYNKLLSQRLLKIYGEIRNEISEEIEYKIKKIIYPKIQKFQNEIFYLIPKNFLTKLSSEIKSDYMNKTLGKNNIYKLIPINFTEGFRENLTLYFKEKFNIDQLEQEYTKNIENDLSELKELFTDFHINIGKRASSATLSYPSGSMNSIILTFENWNKTIKNYSTFYSFELSDMKKNLTTKFIDEKIISPLLSIRTSFEYEKKKQNDEIQKYIDQYQVNDIVADLQTNISMTSISESLERIKNITTNATNNLIVDIGHKFSTLTTELKNNYPDGFQGFNAKTINLRNLEESNNNFNYDLDTINYQINLMSQKYSKFKKEIFLNDTFTNITSLIYLFNNDINRAANSLNYYFLAYETLISDYVDASRVINNLRNQAKNIQIYLREYLYQENYKIEEALSVIKNKIDNGWLIIKEHIDEHLNSAFNDTFRRVFSTLEKFQNSNNNNPVIKPITVYLNNDKNENVVIADFSIDDLNIGYSYSIEVVDVYNFKVNIDTNIDMNAQLNITVLDVYSEITKGNLINGSIGFDNIFTLRDKSLNSTAYIKTNNYAYTKEDKVFNLDTLSWNTNNKQNVYKKENHIYIPKMFNNEI